MKCRLKQEFKDFLYFVCVVSISIILFTLIIGIISLGIGYVFVNMFNICTNIFASSPMEYYIKEGFLFLFIGIFMIGVFSVIIPPMYYIIKSLLTFKYSWKNVKEIFLECE